MSDWMKEGDRRTHTHTLTRGEREGEIDLPSLAEGVSLSTHTHRQKHTNHSTQHTLTGLRAPLGEHIGKQTGH